jgi:hypothetical protein
MSTGKRILYAALLAGTGAAVTVVVAMALGASESTQHALPAAVAAATAAAFAGRRKKVEGPGVAAERRSPQVVGATCAACGERIVLAVEGCACETCRAPLHRDGCATRHACR